MSYAERPVRSRRGARDTCRELAPHAKLQHGINPRRTLRAFLNGSPDVSISQVQRDLKGLYRLMSSLFSAVKHVSHQFALRHQARFAPEEIKALADAERRPTFLSEEAHCWRKYIELADASDADAIEEEIKRIIGKEAESLMKGMSG